MTNYPIKEWTLNVIIVIAIELSFNFILLILFNYAHFPFSLLGIIHLFLIIWRVFSSVNPFILKWRPPVPIKDIVAN